MQPVIRGSLLRTATLTAAAGTLTVGLVTATAPTYADEQSSRHHAATSSAASPHPASLPALMATSAQYAEALRQMSGAELEKTFMGAMVGHHQMAVDMARIELAKGSRPAEKALARRIIRTQAKEIAEMTSWLRNWYGVTPDEAVAQSPAVDLINQMSAQMKSDMMAPLAAARRGTDTDLQFLRLMIPHHKMAVEESQAALPGTVHDRLAVLEVNIKRSQTKEIRLMKTWLRAWFR